MKPYNERHTLLFSATLNPRVGNLAWEYMNDPGEVIIEPEKVTVDTVTQELYHVGKDEKMKLLLGVLKRDDPENAVIFTNTRHSAWEVAKRLEVNGYTVEFLMGDLPQSKRLKIVDEVKKGHHKFLVATDVAARGLHIDELEMVINYDVPLEAKAMFTGLVGQPVRERPEKRSPWHVKNTSMDWGPSRNFWGRNSL
jgi:ATP-dependent RNA helicase RhlB